MTTSVTPNNKLLLVSSWAPPMIGGPQSLYYLFSQFPEDSFAVLTSYKSIIAGSKIGSRLPADYYFYDHSPLRRASQAAVTADPTTTTSTNQPLFIGRVWGYAKTLLRSFWPVKTFLLAVLFIRKTLAFVRTGRSIARQTGISAVIGISDIGPAMLGSYWLSRQMHKPLYYFIFDVYKGNNLEAPGNWVANYFESRMFRRAEKIIVTNEGTQTFYQHRYPDLQNRFAVVHNSVFPEAYESQRTPYRPTPPYRIVFTGHIYWAQEHSVMNLIAAMKQLTDLPLELYLYVPNATDRLRSIIKEMPNIHLTAAPQSEMPAIQSQATLLFLPLAWHTKSPDIIATATPGKFTDYLASGRPMLVHAPDYAYVSQYARQYQLGVVVDHDDVTALADAIRSFLKNPELGTRYVDNAVRIFAENHDARKNAKKLTGLLGLV